MRDLSKYKLVIFDLDETLVPRDGTEVYPKMAQFLLEHCAGKKLAVASNQGGVGLRYWIEQAGGFGDTPEEKAASLADAQSKYPTDADVDARLVNVQYNLWRIADKIVVPFYKCYRYLSSKGNWSPTPYPEEHLPHEWSPHYRKPNPGMLLQAGIDAGVKIEETLYIGDADGRLYNGISRDEDVQAAVAAGVDFISAIMILGGHHSVLE